MYDVKNYVSSFFAKLDDKDEIGKFETKFASYMGSTYSVAFPYARTAIYYALKSQNLQSGSEIIMPPITIKPMMDVVLELGLKPVFVDVDLESYCFDKNDLIQKINSKTKAILITYLFGIVPYNLDELIRISKENNLFVIEDFSHNMNAMYKGKKLGTFGDIGVYSASSIKTFDIYGGGLTITDNMMLANTLKAFTEDLLPATAKSLRAKIVLDFLRNFSTRKFIFTCLTFPLLKFIQNINPILYKKISGARLNLQPEKTIPDEWLESFTSFQARQGLKLLSDLDDKDRKRVDNVEYLKKAFVGLPIYFPASHADLGHVYWQFIVMVEDGERFQKFLAKKNIDSATTNLTLISELDIYPDYVTQLQNAEKIKYDGIFIPSYSTLNQNELDHIIKSVKMFFGKIDE